MNIFHISCRINTPKERFGLFNLQDLRAFERFAPHLVETYEQGVIFLISDLEKTVAKFQEF